MWLLLLLFFLLCPLCHRYFRLFSPQSYCVLDFFFSLASSPSPRLLQVGETSRRDGTVWALVLVRVWVWVLAWARTGSADSAMCRVRACVPSVRACPRRGRVSLSLCMCICVYVCEHVSGALGCCHIVFHHPASHSSHTPSPPPPTSIHPSCRRSASFILMAHTHFLSIQ